MVFELLPGTLRQGDGLGRARGQRSAAPRPRGVQRGVALGGVSPSMPATCRPSRSLGGEQRAWAHHRGGGEVHPELYGVEGAGLVPRPIIRLIQPLRDAGAGVGVLDLLDGGEVRPVGDGSPVAWMAASSPELQSGSSGAIAGCRPNIASAQTSEVVGTAVEGRAL